MNAQNINKMRIKVDRDLAEIMPDYIKRRESNVQEILAALKAGDFEKIQTLGHQMRGTGSSYGLDKITEIGAAIEDEAGAKRSEQLQGLAAQLAVYLKNLEVVFE